MPSKNEPPSGPAPSIGTRTGKKKTPQPIIDAQAARLRACREQSGYSPDQVAQALGLTRQTYMNRERGRVELGVSEVAILSSLFGRPISTFFDDLDVQGGGPREILPVTPEIAEEAEAFLESVAAIPNVDVREKLMRIVKVAAPNKD